jgi:hypothetical protein
MPKYRVSVEPDSDPIVVDVPGLETVVLPADDGKTEVLIDSDDIVAIGPLPDADTSEHG